MKKLTQGRSAADERNAQPAIPLNSQIRPIEKCAGTNVSGPVCGTGLQKIVRSRCARRRKSAEIERRPASAFQLIVHTSQCGIFAARYLRNPRCRTGSIQLLDNQEHRTIRQFPNSVQTGAEKHWSRYPATMPHCPNKRTANGKARPAA